MQVLLTIKIDPRMKSALQSLGESRFTSVSAVVKQAIEGHLKENGIDWRGEIGKGGGGPAVQQRSVGRVPQERYPKKAEPGYHSVEIPGQDNVIRQFNIQQVSPSGLHTILVRDDSALLDGLKAGARMDLTFLGSDPGNPAEIRKTEIAQISREYEGKFKGHYSVGLRLVKDEAPQA